MSMDGRPPVIKLLTLGDSGSGKSSLLLRYTDGIFTDEFVTTIGMDFKFKRVTVRDKQVVKVQIWDTAGQERFRTITQNYYRGAHGIVLVCSVDDTRSRSNIQRWLQDVRKIIRGDNFNADKLVQETKELADDLGLEFVITSAKLNKGVNEAFTKIIEKVYDRLYNSNRKGGKQSETGPREPVEIGDQAQSTKSMCSCGM